MMINAYDLCYVIDNKTKVYKHNDTLTHLMLKMKWLRLLTIPIVATVPPTMANMLTARLYNEGSSFL